MTRLAGSAGRGAGGRGVAGGTPLSGGRATIFGTVVGALIMQVIATSFNMLLVPYAWSLAFKAFIILFAVYLQRPRRV